MPFTRGSWGIRIIALVAGVGLVAAFGYSRLTAAPAKPELRTATLGRGNVTQTVAVSGSLNPAISVRLNFKSAGRLDQISVNVGDKVVAGQPLARLDLIDLQIALDQARANLASAQAKYDQTVAGASAEDIAAARQAVDNAQRSLDTTQRTTQQDVTAAQTALFKMRTGYFSAKQNFAFLTSGIQSDANGYQSLVDDAKSKSAQALVTLAALVTNFTGGPYEGSVKSARSSIGQADSALQSAQSIIANQLKPALTDYANANGNLLATLASFEDALNNNGDVAATTAPVQAAQAAYTNPAGRLSNAIDALSSQISSAQSANIAAQGSLAAVPSALEVGRTDLTALQTSLLNASQALSGTKTKMTQATTSLSTISDAAGGGYVAAQQGLTQSQEKGNASVVTAQNTLAAAQASLTKTAAPARSFDIAAALATVQAAQAQVDAAANNLANATLKAPADGIVASISSQVGEFVTGGGTASPFIVMANTSTIALHGTVGEADVAKLKVGQVATINIDAIGTDKKLTGKITNLDPIATIQQGVPVYGVDVTLDISDSAVRPGMSGTANIIVASKQGVLVVPNLALRNLNGRRGVQAVRAGEVVDVTDVRFGIANEQVTEVLDGLDEGEIVLLPTPRAGATPARGPFGPGVPGGGPPR